jgi:hypothetical protein
MNITPVIKTLQGSSKNGVANLNTFQSLILKALSLCICCAQKSNKIVYMYKKFALYFRVSLARVKM